MNVPQRIIYPRWCWWVPILSCITTIVVIVAWRWWWPVCCPVSVPDADPNLVVQHENTAVWMTTSNEFMGDVKDEPSGAGRDYWKGILLQLGKFRSGDAVLQSVKFYLGGTEIASLLPGEFTWINVVSEFPGASAPVDPTMDRVFHLYPNANAATAGCATFDGCAGPACGSSDPLGDCLRSKKLHHEFEVPQHILTYWQGPDGYELDAKQLAGDFSEHNRYEFVFNDRFQVRVYKEEGDSGSADPTTHRKMTEVSVSGVGGYGTVDKIVIVAGSATGPYDGKHRDPAWPTG